jgi:hypothetical protein
MFKMTLLFREPLAEKRRLRNLKQWEPEPQSTVPLCCKPLKGRPRMQSSPQNAPASLQVGGDAPTQSRKTEDLTYQVLTVAAIVLLLGSLWVF